MAKAPSITTEFGFHLEYVDEQNRVLRNQRLRPVDFGHAIRHTQFDAVRCGLVNAYHPLVNDARILPMFHDSQSASPRAKGFCVTIRLDGGREHGCEFDISYFGTSANRLRSELLRNAVMTSDQKLYYRLTACLDEEELPRPTSKLGLSWEVTDHRVLIGDGCRRDLGTTEAWDDPGCFDLPVLIDLSVLEEVVNEARDEPDCEIGGFLLGHLQRDAETNEVFLAVTGLASGRGTTDGSGTSVTFTPASFVHARSMIKLRAAGESVIGWYHSHPFKLCAECPLPTPPECIAKILFFSQDDVHLMETTFDQPFMVGLLAAVDARIEQSIGHLPVKLYGWCNGEVKPRGFEVARRADNGNTTVGTMNKNTRGDT